MEVSAPLHAATRNSGRIESVPGGLPRRPACPIVRAGASRDAVSPRPPEKVNPAGTPAPPRKGEPRRDPGPPRKSEPGGTRAPTRV
jgi:hypothetical protein